MNTWTRVLLVVLGLLLLAVTAGWWLPLLVNVLGGDGETIQTWEAAVSLLFRECCRIRRCEWLREKLQDSLGFVENQFLKHDFPTDQKAIHAQYTILHPHYHTISSHHPAALVQR